MSIAREILESFDSDGIDEVRPRNEPPPRDLHYCPNGRHYWLRGSRDGKAVMQPTRTEMANATRKVCPRHQRDAGVGSLTMNTKKRLAMSVMAQRAGMGRRRMVR